MSSQQNVIRLGWVSFFTDFASAMVTPILPLYLVLVLAEGVDTVGILSGVATLVSYVLRVLAGFLSDRYDRNKPFLLLGYGISAVSKPLFALAGGWIGVVSLRSLERLGKAVRAAPKDKLISQSAAKGQEGKTFGIHKRLDAAGEMSGLLCLFILLATFGSEAEVFRTIFAVSFLPGVIALLILQFAVQERRGGKAKKQRMSWSLERPLRQPIFLFVGVSFFMFNEAFFVLQGNELGLPLTGILLMLIGMKVVQVSLSARVGTAVDQYSAPQLLTVGYGLGLLAMLLLIRPNLWTLALSFGLFGAHGVIVLNAIRAFIGKNAIDKGAAFGTFYLLYAVGTAVGLFLIGLIWERWGVETAVIYASVGLAVVMLIQLFKARV